MANIRLKNVLSLKEISSRKVSVMVWELDENLNLLKQFHFGSENVGNELKKWNGLLDQVQTLLSKLKLPELLIEEVKPFIKPIGYQILKWVYFHEYYYNWHKNFLRYLGVLSWSSEGTINYRKTAENIVNLGDLDFLTQYQYACLFCLEDNIHALWRRLNLERRFLCNADEPHPAHAGILNYWTYNVRLDIKFRDEHIWEILINNCNACKYAFENAADTGNLVATQYFLPRLMCEERESLIRTAHKIARKIKPGITIQTDCFPKECHRDILNYLLSQLSDEEYLEFLKTYPRVVLSIYLDWPRQHMFLKILEHAWSFLLTADSDFFICMMAKNLDTLAFNYSELLGQVFTNCPLLHTTVILENQYAHGTFLSALFDADDVRNIKLILRKLDLYTKEDLFTCDTGFHICLKLLYASKWSLLDLFIKECYLSEDVSSKIPERFNQFLARIYTDKQIKSLNYRLNKFFCKVSPIYNLKRNPKAKRSKRKKLCRKSKNKKTLIVNQKF